MEFTLAKNDEISLVMPSYQEGSELFEIRLNENDEVVGHISYHYRDYEIVGNVEYFIYEEYRGNNYAKKALMLLANSIYKLDDEDIYLSIHPDNTASIKTAIGCGAVLHHVSKIPDGYVFSCGGKYKYANVYVIKNKGEKNGRYKVNKRK